MVRHLEIQLKQINNDFHCALIHVTNIRRITLQLNTTKFHAEIWGKLQYKGFKSPEILRSVFQGQPSSNQPYNLTTLTRPSNQDLSHCKYSSQYFQSVE